MHKVYASGLTMKSSGLHYEKGLKSAKGDPCQVKYDGYFSAFQKTTCVFMCTVSISVMAQQVCIFTASHQERICITCKERHQ